MGQARRLYRACVGLLVVVMVMSLASVATPVTRAAEGPGGWELRAYTAQKRYEHTATRIGNNHVLVVGGRFSPRTAERYVLATDTWRPAAAPRKPRVNHTANRLVNGKVLVVGGTGDGAKRTAEIYDPVTNTWKSTGLLTLGRVGHTATRLDDGRVLVAGGTGGKSAAEIYDPATNAWTATGSMRAGRFHHTATSLPDGRVLVTGGQGAFSTQLKTTELYDPTTGTWSAAALMTVERMNHHAVSLADGSVLVIGTRGSWAQHTAERYDPAMNQWSPVPAPPLLEVGSRVETATLLNDGTVLITAYNSDPEEILSRRWDPATNTWLRDGRVRIERFGSEAVRMTDGSVLVVGAWGDVWHAERYVPGGNQAPVVPIPTVSVLAANVTASQITDTAIPVSVYAQATDVDGIADYDIELKTGSGPWLPADNVSERVAQPGVVTRFRVRATDNLGAISDWKYSSLFVVTLVQETDASVTYTGTWTDVSVPDASGGSLKSTTQQLSTAKIRFTGTSVALITSFGSGYGSVGVKIDGHAKDTKSLASSTTSYQWGVLAVRDLSNASHTYEVSSLNDSRVDVDGFVYLTHVGP